MIDEKKIQEAAYIWTQDNYGNPVGICAGDLAFFAGAKWALEQSQWIAVQEGLPYEGGRYWCYCEEINDLGISRFQWNCSYSAMYGFTDNLKSIKVTHWMPLPEPPKQ